MMYIHKGYSPFQFDSPRGDIMADYIDDFIVSIGTLDAPLCIHFKTKKETILYLHGDVGNGMLDAYKSLVDKINKAETY